MAGEQSWGVGYRVGDSAGECGDGGAEVVKSQRCVSLVKRFCSLTSGFLLISCVTLD